MLFSYKECLEKFHNDYSIKQAVAEGALYKHSAGLYSDTKYVPYTAVIQKKYPNAVFTLNSAFYFHDLTDSIPSHYYLITDKDAYKIKDKNIKQVFDNYNSMDIGVENLSYSGDMIHVFSKERMFIELIRNKSKLPFDYYKEILGSYRRLVYELDFEAIKEYASKLPKTKAVLNAIQMEVL